MNPNWHGRCAILGLSWTTAGSGSWVRLVVLTVYPVTSNWSLDIDSLLSKVTNNLITWRNNIGQIQDKRGCFLLAESWVTRIVCHFDRPIATAKAYFSGFRQSPLSINQSINHLFAQTTIKTFTSIQVSRAGQQGRIKTLTAARKRSTAWQ